MKKSFYILPPDITIAEYDNKKLHYTLQITLDLMNILCATLLPSIFS